MKKQGLNIWHARVQCLIVISISIVQDHAAYGSSIERTPIVQVHCKSGSLCFRGDKLKVVRFPWSYAVASTPATSQ